MDSTLILRPISTRFQKVAGGIGIFVFLLGFLALIGWLLNIDVFTEGVRGYASVKPNTAICFMCMGFSLKILTMKNPERSLVMCARLSAVVVAVIAVLSISEYVFLKDFGIDQLFFRIFSGISQSAPAGRMAPATAFAMLLSAAALVLLDVPSKIVRIAVQVLPLTTSVLGLLALLGYIYGVSGLYEVAFFSSVALPTALAFFLLGLGTLAARPERAIMRPITSITLGGIVSRRMLPWAILVPSTIGWVRLYGQREGLYNTEFGLILHALSNIVIFSYIIWRNGRQIDLLDKERIQAAERFKLVVEAAPSGLVMVNPSGLVILANRQAEIYFGYTQAELLGQSIELLLPLRFRANHPGFRNMFFGSPQARKMGVGRDLFGRRKDGSEFPVEIGLSPLQLNGETVALSSIVDITERKLAQAKLTENENRYRQLADSMPQLVWTARADGAIEYSNRLLHEFTGVGDDETLHDPKDNALNSITHPEDRALRSAAWQEALATARPYQLEYRLKRKGADQYRWFLDRAVPVRDEAGNITRWYATSTDIDDLKKAQEAIARFNVELELAVKNKTTELQDSVLALGTANKELDSFSYSVSHDLRAPLRAIDGFSRILTEEYATELSSDAKEYLDRVRANTQKMGQLVDDLLAFSRLGRQTLTKRRYDIREMVTQVIDDLKVDIANRPVDFRLLELPPCDCDPALLKHVWLNLIANALKFSRKKNPAMIEIGSYLSERAGVRVYYVKDNGVGFDMTFSNKLFGVFQRMHRAEDFEGTGVGLAIAQRVVQRHGGKIWATAEVNVGATFYFTVEGESDT